MIFGLKIWILAMDETMAPELLCSAITKVRLSVPISSDSIVEAI